MLILDNIVSSDRVSVSSEVSQYGTYIYTYIYINIFKQRYPDKKNFKSFIMPDFSWMKTAQASSNYTVKLITDSTLIKYDLSMFVIHYSVTYIFYIFHYY